VQESIRIELGRDDDGRRADRVVRKALKSVPLSTIYRLFRQKCVRVGARVISGDERVKAGDIMNLLLPHDLIAERASRRIDQLPVFDEAVLARLPDQPCIVWENDQLLALHKPRGMLTHDGNTSLEAFVRHYLRDRLPPSASFIPGPLHRLDRNTSGIVMFSKSLVGAEAFTSEFSAHHIRKFYIAIVQGGIDAPIILENRLNRDQRQRRTVVSEHGDLGKLRIIPLAVKDETTLALIELFTGLTHQIRAQLSVHGHPLKGDAKYGNYERLNQDGYFLHAHTLVFPKFLDFETPRILSDPLPLDFSRHAQKIMESKSLRNACIDEARASSGVSYLDQCILKIIEDLI